MPCTPAPANFGAIARSARSSGISPSTHLFWLDLYLTGPDETFAPPAPFNLDELDPKGRLPERPYTKDEMQMYLEYGRNKCRATIKALTDEHARRHHGCKWLAMTFAESLLYNMRHVQHHAAQLNLILRQQTGSAPRWVQGENRGRRPVDSM